MRKTFLILLPAIQLFLSCNDDIVSPLSNFQISDHILNGNYVTSIAFDSKGTAWVGTFDNGLIKYDGSTIQYNSQNSSLPDSLLIWDIAIDRNDNVWIGSNKGLIKYDNNSFHIYNKSNAPLVTDNVFSLAVDANNIIWFTSCVFNEGGLIKYDGENWTLYSPQNSLLPSSLINDIVVDDKNNKWIASGAMINKACVIKIKGDSWTLFGESEIGFSPYFLWRLTSRENQIYASIDYRLSSVYNTSRPNLICYDGKQWKVNNPVNKKGESLGLVGEIAVDLKGNLWAETSENGIAVYDGEKWFYDKSKFPFESGVTDIAVDRKNSVWIGSGDGIYIIKQANI